MFVCLSLSLHIIYCIRIYPEAICPLFWAGDFWWWSFPILNNGFFSGFQVCPGYLDIHCIVTIYISYHHMGVSLNGGTPNLHPKMIIFSRNTHGCWGNPPFKETPYIKQPDECENLHRLWPEKGVKAAPYRCAVSATTGTDAGVSPATPSVSSGKTVGFWNQREGKTQPDGWLYRLISW